MHHFYLFIFKHVLSPFGRAWEFGDLSSGLTASGKQNHALHPDAITSKTTLKLNPLQPWFQIWYFGQHHLFLLCCAPMVSRCFSISSTWYIALQMRMGTKQEGQHNTVKGTWPGIANHLALSIGILTARIFTCYCMRKEYVLNLLSYHTFLNQTTKIGPRGSTSG